MLGFDTERSTDHGWGPRVVVLFEDGFDLGRDRRIELLKAIDARIPAEFLGYPTRFVASEGGPERHQVMLTTVGEWFTLAVGFDPRGEIATRTGSARLHSYCSRQRRARSSRTRLAS